MVVTVVEDVWEHERLGVEPIPPGNYEVTDLVWEDFIPDNDLGHRQGVASFLVAGSPRRRIGTLRYALCDRARCYGLIAYVGAIFCGRSCSQKVEAGEPRRFTTAPQVAHQLDGFVPFTRLPKEVRDFICASSAGAYGVKECSLYWWRVKDLSTPPDLRLDCFDPNPIYDFVMRLMRERN